MVNIREDSSHSFHTCGQERYEVELSKYDIIVTITIFTGK